MTGVKLDLRFVHDLTNGDSQANALAHRLSGLVNGMHLTGITSGSFLGAAGHTANDLSSWTSVQPGASDVPAGGRVVATVTITVPPDAAPGERYGVV